MKIEKITPQIAALYLGAKCDLEWLYTDTIDDLFVSGDVWRDIDIRPTSIQLLIDEQARITPHLRPLESITEQEARQLYRFVFGVDFPYPSALIWLNNPMTPDRLTELKYGVGSTDIWLWLLSKHFDLFGLIAAGLAKEIKPETVNS